MLKIKILLIGPFPPSLGGVAAISQTILNSSLQEEFDLVKFDINHFKHSFYRKYLGIIFSVLKIIISRKYKLALIQMSGDKSCFREFLIMFLFRLFSKTQIILHFHGMLQSDKANFPFTQSAKASKFQQFLINLIFSQAHKIILLSENIKLQFIGILGNRNTKNIIIMENFIIPDDYSKRTEKSKDIFNVLFVGRLSYYKGFTDIVSIIPEIYLKNKHIHFHFCGTKGKEIIPINCENILEKYQSMGIVKIHGSIEGKVKKQIFSEADILVLPSYKEIFPVVILEAMAQGLPVITTKVGVIETIIKHGENGFLLEPGETDKLKRYIIELFENNGLRNAIADRNIQKVRKTYSTEIAAIKLSDTIHELLKDKFYRILYFIQLPPPIHGVSVINKTVYENDSINENFEKKLLEIKFSETASQSSKLSVLKILRLVKFFFSLLRVLFSYKPDFIYFSIFPTGRIFYRDLLFVLCIKITGVKPIYHLHGKGIDKKSKKIIDHILYKFAFNNSFIIHLSANLIKTEIEVLKLNHCKTFVVENGIPLIEEFKEQIKSDNNTIKLLYLSHVIPAKGIYILLESFKILSNKFPELRLDIVGGFYSEQYKIFISNYISSNKLNDVITIHGAKYNEEKKVFLRNCDIFVHPTLAEAFGIVIIEAMQLGIPVISTNEGSIPEILDFGLSGLIVEKNNPIELANAIESLISNKGLREMLGNRGREKFLKTYTLPIFENKMKKVFNEILHS